MEERIRIWMQNCYRLNGNSVREEQYNRITRPELTTFLESNSIIAATCGIEYRMPLIDIPLMEFHMSLPSSLKRCNGWGRYIFRRSVKDIIPDEIQWRTDKFNFVHPWLMHSYMLDEGSEMTPPPENATEEVKFYYWTYPLVC